MWFIIVKSASALITQPKLAIDILLERLAEH